MHVEQHDVRGRLEDRAHGLVDGGGVADDFELPLELRAHTGAEQLVIVDDDDAGPHRSILSSTSVPPPSAVRIVACPPWRSIRPMIDSRTPRRSGGIAAG